MKKSKILYFITGIVIGAFLFAAVPAIAATVTATTSTWTFFVDGEKDEVSAYSIDGSNYMKLRDALRIADVGVWYDEPKREVYIETDKGYDPDYNGPVGAVDTEEAKDAEEAAPTEDAAAAGNEANTEGAYKITDYYNSEGKLSELGEALPKNNDGENVLTLKKGDIVVVGDVQYEVTAESLDLQFYSQPSLDQVIVWWTEYMNSWLESGKVAEVK